VIGPIWAFLVAVPVALTILLFDVRAGRPARRVLAGHIAVAHVAVVVALTLLPVPVTDAAIAASRELVAYDHNAIPLSTLGRQLSAGISPFELRNLVGNSLLLLPLGLYAPMRSPRLQSAWRVIGVAMAVAVGIELGQLAISTVLGFPHRIADVDDVIVNVAGAMVGYGLWRLGTIGRLPTRESAAAGH
jgi:glycopeptide antibiotics resistance protein